MTTMELMAVLVLGVAVVSLAAALILVVWRMPRNDRQFIQDETSNMVSLWERGFQFRDGAKFTPATQGWAFPRPAADAPPPDEPEPDDDTPAAITDYGDKVG